MSDNIYAKLTKPLEISEIDFRVQSINNGGYATILAYKDARVDMKRLDEACGFLGWKREHKELKGVIYCGISIFDKDNNHWVTKWDAGTESNTEAQKGESSDSFKRAGFNWGIGRELYDYPVISVKLNDNELKETGKERPKYKASYNFNLKKWNWESKFVEGKIILKGYDEKGNLRFDSESQPTNTYEPKTPNNTQPTTQAKEKKWLNKKGTDGKVTTAWNNVLTGIKDGKIKNIKTVQDRYKVSKSLQEEINNLIKNN